MDKKLAVAVKAFQNCSMDEFCSGAFHARVPSVFLSAVNTGGRRLE
jgi:hypothetical protein